MNLRLPMCEGYAWVCLITGTLGKLQLEGTANKCTLDKTDTCVTVISVLVYMCLCFSYLYGTLYGTCHGWHGLSRVPECHVPCYSTSNILGLGHRLVKKTCSSHTELACCVDVYSFPTLYVLMKF